MLAGSPEPWCSCSGAHADAFHVGTLACGPVQEPVHACGYTVPWAGGFWVPR